MPGATPWALSSAFCLTLVCTLPRVGLTCQCMRLGVACLPHHCPSPTRSGLRGAPPSVIVLDFFLPSSSPPGHGNVGSRDAYGAQVGLLAS